MIVVFGDSWSDGGTLGHGLMGSLESSDFREPWYSVMIAPLEKIREDYGSAYPFKEMGYHQGCFSDGISWPHCLGSSRVMNFAHGGATTCQGGTTIPVPPGYVALPSVSDCCGHEVRPRGVAQQIMQAKETLSEEDWRDPDTWVIVGPISNDVLFHGPDAIGHKPEDACDSPYVSNYRQIISDLKHLGVPKDRIIVTGVGPLELLPGMAGFDLDWLRSQVDAVNEIIEGLLPGQRWTADHLIRGLGDEDAAKVRFYVYEALSRMKPEDLGKLELPTRAEGEVALWFDEFHPDALLHRKMAAHFVEQFFVSGEKASKRHA